MMNIKLIKNSIQYSTDVVNIVKEYAEVMDKYFSDDNNRKEHEFCYSSYITLSNTLKDYAMKRGIIKK